MPACLPVFQFSFLCSLCSTSTERGPRFTPSRRELQDRPVWRRDMVVVCLGCSGPPCLSGRNPVMASIAGSMGCARSKEDDQILASIGRVWFNKQKQNEILPWSQEGTKLKTPHEGTGSSWVKKTRCCGVVAGVVIRCSFCFSLSYHQKP